MTPRQNPRLTLRMTLMLVAVTVVFGGVFGMQYLGRKAVNDYFDNAPVTPATITAARVEPMTWDNRLDAIGSVVAVNGAAVTTEAGGIVTAIHFESGAMVERGARLVTLDAANERGEFERLKAQARLAELNLARREKLFALDAVAKADVDAARAESDAARAAVQAQQALLAQKEIRAPFSGQLGIRQVNLGQYLAAGTGIVWLQSLDPVEFDFALPEQNLARVQPGLPVDVRIEAFPERAFTGAVTAVEPRVDPDTRNFQVRARLPNPDHHLRAGQFGRVALLLPGTRQVLAVPRTAVSYSSYGTSVYVIRPIERRASAPAGAGKDAPQATLEVVQRFVRTGEARGDFVAVTEGLASGDQVATSGLLKLRNQLPVVIDNRVVPDARLDPRPGES